MFRDIVYSTRRLLRRGAFSATVIVLLGLALGANACVFSVLYGLLYKPLPYPAGDRLVKIDVQLATQGMDVGPPVPFVDAIAKHSRTLDAVAAYRSRTIASAEDNATHETYESADVEPALFPMLGAKPALGRLFVEDDAASGAARNAVIGWNLWQRRFGGSRDAIGRTLKLADGDYRIIGVLSRGFAFPHSATSVWRPLGFTAAERGPDQAGLFGDLALIARPKPGATHADISADLAAIAHELPGMRELVDSIGVKAEAKPLRNLWLGERAPALELMLLAVALVLFVAAANVCNLHIAGVLSRRRETAVLDALGASRWRHFRQTLAEALILCAAASALALALVPSGLALLRHFELVPADAPQPIGIDAVTLAFLAALAAACACAMAICARWVQRGDGFFAVRNGGPRQTHGRGTELARQSLIVAQIAITAALLVGVGLLLQSSQRLLAEDVGFDRDGLLVSMIADLPKRAVPNAQIDPAAKAAAEGETRALVERIGALPGVTAVGLGSLAPFGWTMSVSNFALPGSEEDASEQPTANDASVNGEFFAALGMHVTKGRTFTDEEVRSRADVAVVDETFVHRVLHDADPIGSKFRMGDPGDPTMREFTIVGVVPTAKFRALDESPERPTIYRPDPLPLDAMLLVRSKSDPAALVEPIKTAFQTVAPSAHLGNVVTMGARIADTLRDRTRLDALLGLLGAMALTVAVVGLYAVLAYSVRMRTGEFGVRMTLGASHRDVMKSVLLQGARLIVAGLALALPLAWAVGRLLSARLYRIGTFDVATLAIVAALLCAVAVFACWWPARRAARVDPVVALRHE
jgi:predicted permease